MYSGSCSAPLSQKHLDQLQVTHSARRGRRPVAQRLVGLVDGDALVQKVAGQRQEAFGRCEPVVAAAFRMRVSSSVRALGPAWAACWGGAAAING